MKNSYYVPISPPINGTAMLRGEWDTGWQHPVACDAICPDGKIHRVRLNQQADNAFSWSGRVNFKGKTRKCYITSSSDSVIVCHVDGYEDDGVEKPRLRNQLIKKSEENLRDALRVLKDVKQYMALVKESSN